MGVRKVQLVQGMERLLKEVDAAASVRLGPNCNDTHKLALVLTQLSD